MAKEKDAPKPKVEGNKKNFHRRSARNAGPARKEFVTKVAGLENHTFDVGNAKYAAKYQKTVDWVANHIQRNYKGGPKIAKAIRDIILPTIIIPNYPIPVTGMVIDKRVKYIWQQEVQEAMKRIMLLNKNKKQAYALVFGQSLPELISKIQGTGAYIQANQDQDVIQLLIIIRRFCCSFEDHQQSTYVLEGAKHRVLIYYRYDATTTKYVEHFKELVDVVETYREAYVNEPGLITAQLIEQGQPGSTNPDKIKKAEAVC